jgi:hypothetical protein
MHTNNNYSIPVHIYTRIEQFSIGVSLQRSLVQPYPDIQEGAADGHHASPATVRILRRWSLPTNIGTFSKCESHLAVFRLFESLPHIFRPVQRRTLANSRRTGRFPVHITVSPASSHL